MKILRVCLLVIGAAASGLAGPVAAQASSGPMASESSPFAKYAPSVQQRAAEQAARTAATAGRSSAPLAMTPPSSSSTSTMTPSSPIPSQSTTAIPMIELPAALRARMQEKAGLVRVLEAWARPAALGSNGAVYVTLRGGEADDVLLGAYTPWARKTTLHATVIDDKDIDDKGGTQMQPLVPLPVKAGALVAFAPGQQHVMLEGMTRSVATGQMFPLTLNFEKAGAVRVMVTVRAAVTASGAPVASARPRYRGTSGTMTALSTIQEPEVAQPTAPQAPDAPMMTAPAMPSDYTLPPMDAPAMPPQASEN